MANIAEAIRDIAWRPNGALELLGLTPFQWQRDPAAHGAIHSRYVLSLKLTLEMLQPS